MFLLYNFLITILSPIWVPWMLWRTAKRAEKPNWQEKFGNYNLKPGPDRVWIHAVSVGEVVAALPILREVRQLLPGYEIVLSVTTSSGHQTAREQATELVDHLVYFPLDIARFQLSAMQRVRPKVVAIMETELWMNFLWAANTFGASTLLMNGRISDRSFPRSRRLAFFYRALLKNVDRCLMQTQKDGERILALGARSAEVLGNCKFDQAAEGLDADPDLLRQELGLPEGVPLVVVGSTRSAEEEALVIAALRAVGDVAVVHAPRHLERVPDLLAQVPDAWLRSRGMPSESQSYIILDTYGELSKVYAVADVVVIGGGFSNLGGQNLLQPLAHGKPVIHGPHMQNFAEVAKAAAQAGATKVASTEEELAEALREILASQALRIEMGDAARQLVQGNLGASRRYGEAIATSVRPRV